jgi:hypothetical protein
MRYPGGRPEQLRSLPRPFVEEAYYDPPKITWQPLPG